MATSDWVGFEFDVHPIDDESRAHLEVSVGSRAWIDETMRPGPTDARAFLVERRRAARILGRVLAGVVREVEEVRAKHGCPAHPLAYDRCGFWASDVVVAVTGDLGDFPEIAVTVPAKEAKEWRARLARDIKAIVADDSAVEKVARQVEADRKPAPVRELRALPPPSPGHGGAAEPTHPHAELTAYRAARDAARGSS